MHAIEDLRLKIEDLKDMRVLFVSAGRKGIIKPIIKNQGDSLLRAGVDVEFYVLSSSGMKGYLKNIKPLRKQIKSGNYDVVHSHFAFSAYLASIASIGLRVPMVVSLMGSDIWDRKIYPYIVRMFARLKPWKSVIVKSSEMRDRVGMLRAIVVPNGVNMEKFSPMDKVECQKKMGWDPEKVHVLFPANPEEHRKNWPLAEGAVALLNKSSKFNIEMHSMWGVPNDQTPLFYNAADAVVLPSYYEGSANAVKEAMACNRPLVTTDMGDCRERIEGCEGCYVANTYEVEEFAELLGKALQYEKSGGRERLLKDGIADYQIAERLIKIYEGVMG